MKKFIFALFVTALTALAMFFGADSASAGTYYLAPQELAHFNPQTCANMGNIYGPHAFICMNKYAHNVSYDTTGTFQEVDSYGVPDLRCYNNSNVSSIIPCWGASGKYGISWAGTSPNSVFVCGSFGGPSCSLDQAGATLTVGFIFYSGTVRPDLYMEFAYLTVYPNSFQSVTLSPSLFTPSDNIGTYSD